MARHVPTAAQATAGHRRAPARARGARAGARGARRALARLPVPRPAGHGQARDRARVRGGAAGATGARDAAERSRERVARDAHPDLTWVRRSGAAEMLVADIEEPVVAAATRTPFESARRVFVIEAVETMNDQAANRMLKTLEEPPDVRAPAAADATAARTCCRRSPRAASRCASTRCRRSAIAERRSTGVDGERARGVRAAGARRRAAGRRGWRARPGAALRASAEALRARGARRRRRASARGRRCSSAAKAARRAGGRGGRAAAAERARAVADEGAQTPRARSGRGAPARRAPRAHADARPRRCAWPSCGCATCCACARGRAELVYAVDRRGRAATQDAAGRERAPLREAIELVRRHAPAPAAVTSPRSWRWRRSPTACRRCSSAPRLSERPPLDGLRRSARGSARGRRSRTP